jgi:molybdopterin molybdotransferase
MQEDARREGDRMWVLNRTEKRFIRERGEEARPGEVVLRQGVRLGATELAALAQIGRATPLVHRGVQILHVATGSELVAPEATPKGGQIRDTNSALSAALFETCARVVVRRERAGDDFDSLKALIEKAPECPDLVAISGGASVGDYDFGAKVLRALGYTIHFDRVNLRPGKPLTFASRGSQIAFVIPGNPVSHFVCFHAAIRLALERLAGAAPAWSWIDVALEHAEMLRLDPRETFWPAKTVVAEGRLLAKPQRWSSSGDTFSLAGVNTLLRIAPTWQQGATAPALLLDVPSSA